MNNQVKERPHNAVKTEKCPNCGRILLRRRTVRLRAESVCKKIKYKDKNGERTLI
ncbi:MAG: hypothetical protein L6V93_10135 [Clostridiales bacterium]|nr:MAG: hypothetical protein L6V93_10135 [Clostridiales bacterium]